MAVYVPAQGDLVILTFDPQKGHEQRGRRPALIVSVEAFNRGTGMAMCCPVTNTARKSAFHLPVPPTSGLSGFVMCEQMKSLDYRARQVKKVGEASQLFVEDVLAILDACLFP